MSRASHRWPNLMADLSADHVEAIDATVAAQCLEGWSPTESDVSALVSACRGVDPLDTVLPAPSPRARTLRNWLRRSEPYVYPGSTVLRNAFGIEDADHLARLEFSISSIRLCQWHCGLRNSGSRKSGQPSASAAQRLLHIHRHLFGDLYPWAGSTRSVNLSKGGTSFVPVPHIWRGLMRVEETIEAAEWPSYDIGEMSYALAVVYADLNQVHPFREGNGRAATTLLHDIVADTSIRLDLSAVSRRSWIEASRDSAPFRRDGRPSPRPFVALFGKALTLR